MFRENTIHAAEGYFLRTAGQQNMCIIINKMNNDESFPAGSKKDTDIPWYGWVMVVCIVVLVTGGAVILKSEFPAMRLPGGKRLV